MPQTKIVAVDQALSFADNSMPQPLIDAWANTTTFAQAHARTVSSDPSSRAYFDAMTKELQQIAWNVIEATRVDYKQQAEKISPAGIVSSILDPYLTPDQQAALAGLLNAIKQPDVGVHNFLDFWWNKASTKAGQTSMAMGPLTEKNNSSDIQIVYYSFNFQAEDWRSLFVEHDSASLGVTAYHLNMNLNLSLYNDIKEDLISKLDGKEKEHIQQTSLDL